MFSINRRIQKFPMHSSVRRIFIAFTYFILKFWCFPSKTYFCFFSLFKSVSNNNNNKQIAKRRTKFYTNISCTQIKSSLVVLETGRGRDWTLAFFNTFYSCSGVQDFISTNCALYRKRNFRSVLKRRLNQIWR